jgi:hypothetical protein
VNHRIWKIGVLALVLGLVGLPAAAVVFHSAAPDVTRTASIGALPGLPPFDCDGCRCGSDPNPLCPHGYTAPAPVPAAPVPAAPVHHSPFHPFHFGLGGGMVAIVAAGYGNMKTGRGNPIPALPNGGVDINALIGQMVDRGIWHYYYTLKLAAGATIGSQYTLFNSATGSPDPYPLSGSPILTKVETNMPNTSTNGFNAPRDLILDQLGFAFNNTRLADMVAFDQYSYFEFKIIDKVFFEGKLKFHPSGTGFSGFSTNTGEGNWTAGIPNPMATNRFNNFSKYIAPQMNWSLVLYFPPTSGPSAAALTLTTANNGGTGLTLETFLKGLTDRAVQ